MFKLIFFIYVLFNFNIAQTPSNKILHVRYNEKLIMFEQIQLDIEGINLVDDLIELIKFKLRNEKLSDKVSLFVTGKVKPWVRIHQSMDYTTQKKKHCVS